MTSEVTERWTGNSGGSPPAGSGYSLLVTCGTSLALPPSHTPTTLTKFHMWHYFGSTSLTHNGGPSHVKTTCSIALALLFQ